MKSTAFTLIELIIVIVIAGILAAVMIPRLERDSLREATHQVIRHIQYTQHLAMNSDMYDANDGNWSRKYWKIAFRTSKNCYSIYSDRDKNFLNDANESAIDPLSKVRLYADNNCNNSSLNNDALLLQKSYGIETITLTIPIGATSHSNDCNTNTKKYLAFDNLGRPHTSVVNAVSGIMINDCLITLTSGIHNAIISVSAETGYVKLLTIN